MKHTAASADAPTPLRRRLVLAGALLPALRPVRAAARTLVLGQVTSLSGNNGADLGQGLKAGIEACLQASNAAGGVRGQMLRLVSKDDGYAPEETVRQTRALIEEVQPVALIGYRGTANTLAVIESRVLAQSGITLVGSLTGEIGRAHV